MANISGKKYDIEYLVGTNDQTAAGLKDAEKNIKKFADQGKTMLGKFKSEWTLLDKTIGITAGVLAARKAYQTLQSVIFQVGEAASREQKRISFDNLARSFGSNAEYIIAQLKRVSNEVITEQQAMESAGQAMLLGLKPTEIVRLMDVARQSVKVTGDSIGKAFSDITIGVARQSKLILDNLGIIVDVEKANKTYAAALGKVSTELTDVEKKQAFLNATYKAGEENAKRIGGAYGELSLELQRANANMTDSWTKLKDAVFGSSAWITVLKAAAAVTKKITEDLAPEKPTAGATNKNPAFIDVEEFRKYRNMFSRTGREFQFRFPVEFDLAEKFEAEVDKILEEAKRIGEAENVVVNGKSLSDLVDIEAEKIFKGIDTEAEKAYKEMYDKLEVKTKDWVKHETAELQKLRDWWALFDEDMANQLFSEGQKQILQEFVESRTKKDDEKELTAGQQMGKNIGDGIAMGIENSLSDAMYGIFTGDGLQIESLLESFGRSMARTISDALAEAMMAPVKSFLTTLFTNMAIAGATSGATSAATSGATSATTGGSSAYGGSFSGGTSASRIAPESNRITINNYIYEDAMLEKKVNSVVSKAIRNNTAISKQMRNN